METDALLAACLLDLPLGDLEASCSMSSLSSAKRFLEHKAFSEPRTGED